MCFSITVAACPSHLCVYRSYYTSLSRLTSAKMYDNVYIDYQHQSVTGLYRDLDTHFTKEYCILWRALVLGDVQVLSLLALLVLY